ncbi:hypothetical protein [uncultured Methylobacterium sp.]
MGDHLADVKTDAKKPVDEVALEKMAKTYRPVLSKPDTGFVVCSHTVGPT